MAESEGMIGYGSKLSYSETSISGPWTEVAEVLECPPPSPEVDEAELTHQQSPDYYREFVATLIDPGDTEITLNYTPASHELAMTKIRQSIWWRIELPDGTTFDFKAYVKSVSNENPIDDRITFSITLRVSGPIVPTYPS